MTTLQSAINMHLSQISHGIVKGDSFVDDGDNTVVCGYTPSMVKIYLLDDTLDPVTLYYWYDWDPDYVYTGAGREDSFIETNERGFVLDGEAALVLDQAAAGFVWETYGCQNNDDYHWAAMNPDAVAADDAMDPIDGWEPVTDHSHDSEESS
jgi:hypothetical protein